MTRSKVPPLTAEQEAEVEGLVQRFGELAQEELREIARLLVGKPTRELFGDTEFQIRDILLRIGAKAYQEHLAQKKTATSVAASNAPAADRLPSSKTTDAKRP